METLEITSVTVKELRELFLISEIEIDDFKAIAIYDEEDYYLSASFDLPNDEHSVELWKGEDEVKLNDEQYNFIVNLLKKSIENENGKY